jgi:hypothetical protein
MVGFDLLDELKKGLILLFDVFDILESFSYFTFIDCKEFFVLDLKFDD